MAYDTTAPENTFIWRRGDVAFVCVGKAANSSIKAAVLSAEGGVDPDTSVHFDPRIEYIPNHRLARVGVLTVTVVRDPWDRLVSFYHDKIVGTHNEHFVHLGLWPGMRFADVVRRVCELDDSHEDCHLASQVSLLVQDGKFLPHVVLRFERLHEEWAHLRRIRPALPALPHVNRSRARHTIPFSTDLVHLVHDRYRSDYDRFGYAPRLAVD